MCAALTTKMNCSIWHSNGDERQRWYVPRIAKISLIKGRASLYVGCALQTDHEPAG